jgi:hypothetical protein
MKRIELVAVSSLSISLDSGNNVKKLQIEFTYSFGGF